MFTASLAPSSLCSTVKVAIWGCDTGRGNDDNDVDINGGDSNDGNDFYSLCVCECVFFFFFHCFAETVHHFSFSKIESHRCYDVWPSIWRFLFVLFMCDLLSMFTIVTIEYCVRTNLLPNTRFIFIWSFLYSYIVYNVYILVQQQWRCGRFHSVTFFFAQSTQFLMSFLRLTVQWLPLLYRVNSISYIYVNMLSLVQACAVLFGNFIGVICYW